MRVVALALPGLVACGAARGNAESHALPTGTRTPAGTTSNPTPIPPRPALAAVPTCPPDMAALPEFCIDHYEAPNEPGVLPLALQTAQDGETWCADRDKRLCREDEWVRACEGPHGRRFPYGPQHREGVCNDERPWIPVHWELLAKWPRAEALEEALRLFQGEPSGNRPGCVSEEGVRDLTGNVAEWVRRSDVAPRPGYDHVLKGCYWAGCYHEPHPNCAFRNSAHPGSFRTYEAGFRCCMDRAP